MTFSADYSCKDVATVLGMTPQQVRGYVRAGLLDPSRGPRGEMRFSFQDVVLLRSARGLTDQLSVRKIRRGLRALRERLPAGTGLSAVSLGAEGRDLVVRDPEGTWEPESGQVRIEFDSTRGGSSRPVATIAGTEDRPGGSWGEVLAGPGLRSRSAADPVDVGYAEAEDWFERGLELEATGPGLGARDAYEHALELDPTHAGACVNLGRLEHEAGNAARAAELYRRALQVQPAEPIAWFNLGVALEDLGEDAEAAHAYARVVELDARAADAHFNLSRLCERLGDRAAALRHLRAYRDLSR